MTGSMYASVAGLRAHMQKLTVIGNNVANVNTAAYKKQRTVFRDSVYSMYTSGSDGTQVVGGKNPSQLGYGSLVANIDLNMSSATYNPGNPMDCAIAGDGFFLVGDKEMQDNLYTPGQPELLPNALKGFKLTRVGDFQFKPDGYLSDGQGNVVYGFQCIGMDSEGNPIMSDQLVGLRLPKMEKAVVNTDTGAVIEPGEDGNYADGVMGDDGTLANGYKWSYTIRYPVNQTTNTDGGGNGGETTYIPLRDYDPALDGATAGDNNNNNGNTIASAENTLAYAELESVEISANGCISGTSRETGEPVIIGYLALGVVQNPNGVSHVGSSYYQAGAGAGDLRVTMMDGVQTELGLTYVNGELYRNVNGDGGDADNTTTTLPDKAQITSAGETKLMPGFLEAPNVDLAEEITELITTQRGYQANTRIITVTDSMLEELVNMKR